MVKLPLCGNNPVIKPFKFHKFNPLTPLKLGILSIYMSFFYHTTISLAILAAFPFIVLRMVFDPGFRADIIGRVCGAKDIESLPGCLWIHAASVGEVRIAKILITALQEKGETRPIIVSTFTPTGFAQAQKEGLGLVFRMPPDSPLWLNKVFDRLHPSLLVLIEAEMWPGLLDGCRRRRIPVLLANGRISQKSVDWYGKFPFIFRWLAASVSFFSVRTQTDADRLLDLGVALDKVRVNGNIKFDALLSDVNAPPESGPASGSNLIVFGSTRPGDEGPVMEAILKLHEGHPNLRFVIAPRHLERCREVEGLIREYGVEFKLHSRLGEMETPALVLLDEMGELNKYYASATLAFVGGGFNPRFGGQNILEPAGHGLPVIFGRHMNNFEEEARLLVRSGGGIQIDHPAQLHDALHRLLMDPEQRRRRGQSAWNTIVSNRGAVEKTIELMSCLETK